MLNSYNVVGRLTKDPELRESNGGSHFTTFSLAIDNPVKEADGTRGTCFLDARAFGLQSEAIAKSLRKGSKVAVSGAIAQRDFVRQDGSKGRSYEIIVNTIEFLDPKPVSEDQAVEQEVAEVIQDLPDDDLPFKKEETKPQAKVDNSAPYGKLPKGAKFDPMTGKPLTTPTKKK